jgi:hypothetical protein
MLFAVKTEEADFSGMNPLEMTIVEWASVSSPKKLGGQTSAAIGNA